MSDEQKIWTFAQMLAKVKEDSDLDEDDPDEQFISFAEFTGYFNEAINEAESEILKLDEDYFLAKDYMPLVAGQSEYDYPSNIYANKLRAIIYKSGSTIYPIRKYRRNNKFENIAFAEQYGAGDDYTYYPMNNAPGQRKIILLPPARETAVMPPQAAQSTPVVRWYIRQANRIPLVGDYINKEDILPANVDTIGNTIAVEPEVAYVTGDAVKLYLPSSASTLPAPLAVATVYYVIAVSSTSIKLASSLSLARAGTALDLTTQGTGFFSMKVAATEAIINATVIDIPEFSTFIMEWVKANCLFKDGDPRLAGSVAKLEQQRDQMVTTLKENEVDDDNAVEADYSHYSEMS